MVSWVEDDQLAQMRADVADQERDLRRLEASEAVSPEAAVRGAETRAIVKRGLARLRANLAEAEGRTA